MQDGKLNANKILLPQKFCGGHQAKYSSTLMLHNFTNPPYYGCLKATCPMLSWTLSVEYKQIFMIFAHETIMNERGKCKADDSVYSKHDTEEIDV